MFVVCFTNKTKTTYSTMPEASLSRRTPSLVTISSYLALSVRCKYSRRRLRWPKIICRPRVVPKSLRWTLRCAVSCSTRAVSRATWRVVVNLCCNTTRAIVLHWAQSLRLCVKTATHTWLHTTTATVQHVHTTQPPQHTCTSALPQSFSCFLNWSTLERSVPLPRKRALCKHGDAIQNNGTFYRTIPDRQRCTGGNWPLRSRCWCAEAGAGKESWAWGAWRRVARA